MLRRSLFEIGRYVVRLKDIRPDGYQMVDCGKDLSRECSQPRASRRRVRVDEPRST